MAEMRGSVLAAVVIVAAQVATAGRPAKAGRLGPAQSVLPGRFGAWQAVPHSARAVTLAELPPAQAAVLRDCHEQAAERQSYRRGGASLEVTVYSLADPSWAYSAYSFLRPAPVTSFKPTPHAAIGREDAMMLVGNFLVEVTGEDLAADRSGFVALARALQRRASRQAYPSLPDYLPAKGLVPHTDRYAPDPSTLEAALLETETQAFRGRPGQTPGAAWPGGDWLGFGDEAEAETAQYEIGAARMTLILASYPTPQLAEKFAKGLARGFEINPPPGQGTGGKLPILYERRSGSMLGLVFGTGDAAAAARLLGEIRYQSIVTWDEPPPGRRPLTMVDYVVGIIFGTFTILGITLIAGLALGIIRVGIKRTWPGLIFDRRRSVEILQLGLTTKPIDPTDFY